MIIGNLLPVDFQYKIIDREEAISFSGTLCKGEQAFLNTVDLTHLIGLELTLLDPHFNVSEVALINNVDDSRTRPSALKTLTA